jgi:hypothetical protein
MAHVASLLENRQDYIKATGNDLLPGNGAYYALNNHFASDKYKSLYLNTVNEAGETEFRGISEEHLEAYRDTYIFALNAVQRSNTIQAVADFHFTKLYASSTPGEDTTRMTVRDTDGFVTTGSIRETDEGLELTTTLSLITNKDTFEFMTRDGIEDVDVGFCTIPLHHHEQALTWAELEATGGISEAAYREQVKTESPYQACYVLYEQQTYIETHFFNAFEFELTRNKSALMKGLLENDLTFNDYREEYQIKGSRVATRLAMDEKGITFEPLFEGHSFPGYAIPPSKEFENRDPLTLSWDALESQFGITKASFEAAKFLEEDPMQAMKVAYAARSVSTESYSMDFSESE